MHQARARIFAERAYKARVICEGEDSPETLRVKSLALIPAVHSSFEVFSRKWKRTRDSVPKGLNTVEFKVAVQAGELSNGPLLLLQMKRRKAARRSLAS